MSPRSRCLILALLAFAVGSILRTPLGHARRPVDAAQQPARTAISVCLPERDRDGTSRRLAAAIGSAIDRAATLSRVPCASPRRPLVVTVPQLALSTGEAGETLVLYRADVAQAQGPVLSSDSGSCWEDELHVCAGAVVSQVLAAAEQAAAAPATSPEAPPPPSPHRQE